MGSSKALIIVNRKARMGGADLKPAVDTFQHQGIGTIIVRTQTPDDIHRAVLTHIDQIDRIVVGGGDGTLNASLSSVLDRHLPLGILPLGTGNDLARTLNIPFSLETAAKIIASGHIQRIDLGTVNGTYFFNAASVGLAVDVTHSFRNRRRQCWEDE